MEEVSVVLLGAEGVGAKTTLCHTYRRNMALKHVSDLESAGRKDSVSSAESTVFEDGYRVQKNICGQPVVFDILDTSGDSTLRDGMISDWVSSRDAVVLGYDVTVRKTFEEAAIYFDGVRRYVQKKGREMPTVVLVGNKIDRAESRCVSMDEGRDLARHWKVHYVETSALSGKNVATVFQTIAKEVIERRRGVPLCWEEDEVKGSKKDQRKANSNSSSCAVC